MANQSQQSQLRSFEMQTVIQASSMQVLFAFLNEEAIKKWWGARNVVIQPRPGGLFLIEWDPGYGGEDSVLGPMGGVLGGILDSSQAGHFIHFGSLHWLSPKGDVYGPTRLLIDVRSRGNPRDKPTLLTLQVEHFQSGEGWDRYFEVVQENWKETLESLKQWCESEAPKQPDSRIMSIGDSYLAEAVLKKRRIS
jgi:uncharacterized protein YndB with AHSA1/START domain